MKVNDLTQLFDTNDKSPVTVIDSETEDILFEDRIDYIQYPFTEHQEMINNAEIVSLDVNDGRFIIYINSTLGKTGR